MGNVIVAGAQWGDEGKGKVVDWLAQQADVVVRHQGGANAGHTVWVGEERFVLHLIPSGILHAGKKCIIANGVVVDPEVLAQEVRELKARGYLKDDGDLLVSEGAQVVLPYHKKIDLLREEKKGEEKIGTTGRGIGPAYEDKVARRGIRLGEFLNREQFRSRLQRDLPETNRYIKQVLGGDPFDPEELFQRYWPYALALGPYCGNASLILAEEMKKGRQILFECAQGALLDVDYGTYPFVTSSCTLAGGALSGAGVGPTRISAVVGVAKAYTTRVGSGPFPSEIKGELGDHLREKGREYGATTGRPRRCGWFDAVGCRYAVRINGMDLLAVTKLDVLSGLETVKICTAYDYRGNTLTEFPANPEVLAGSQPIYEELAGWEMDISQADSLEALPAEARKYLARIEELLEVEIGLVSVGFDRERTIIIKNPFLVKR